MVKAWIASSILISLLIFQLFTPVQSSYGLTPASASRRILDKMIRVAEKAELVTKRMLELATQYEIAVPQELFDQFEYASSLLDSAKSENNATVALDMLMRAMSTFRDIIREVSLLLEEVPEIRELTEERAIWLLSRTKGLLEESLVRANSLNVTVPSDLADRATVVIGKLDELISAIESGEDLENLLPRAKEVASEAIGLRTNIMRIIAESGVLKAEIMREEAVLKRLSVVAEQLNQSLISSAAKALESAKEALKTGNMEVAREAVKEARKIVIELLSEVRSWARETTRDKARTMAQEIEEIMQMAEEAVKFAFLAGGNVSDVVKEMQMCRGLLARVKNRGDVKALLLVRSLLAKIFVMRAAEVNESEVIGRNFGLLGVVLSVGDEGSVVWGVGIPGWNHTRTMGRFRGRIPPVWPIRFPSGTYIGLWIVKADTTETELRRGYVILAFGVVTDLNKDFGAPVLRVDSLHVVRRWSVAPVPIPHRP